MHLHSLYEDWFAFIVFNLSLKSLIEGQTPNSALRTSVRGTELLASSNTAYLIRTFTVSCFWDKVLNSFSNFWFSGFSFSSNEKSLCVFFWHVWKNMAAAVAGFEDRGGQRALLPGKTVEFSSTTCWHAIAWFAAGLTVHWWEFTWSSAHCCLCT